MLEKLQKQIGKGILQVLDCGYTRAIEWPPTLCITHIQLEEEKTFTYTLKKGKKQPRLLA